MTKFENGYVVNPYYELKPDYKICPFTNKDLIINRTLPFSNLIDDYFRRSELYAQLMQRYNQNLGLTVSFHSVRRVIIDHISDKLREHTRLFNFSKWFYKKFIVRFIY